MHYKLPFENIKRKILIKAEGIIAGEPSPPAIEELLEAGIINIDKPKNCTSHDVKERAALILNIKKAGHAGTLDPAVTGCLPVAIGRATRVLQALLPAGKEYICTMRLHNDVTDELLEKTFDEFTGSITQTPPVRSRVKREPRKREIYYMQILERNGREVTFKVGCQAGTYIRKLVHDMGLAMNIGAHMKSLRRTKAGPFFIDYACTLDELSNAATEYQENQNPEPLKKIILPIESAVSHLSKIWVFDEVIEPLSFGHDLFVPGIVKLHDDIEQGQSIAIMTLQDKLIALGQAQLTSQQILTQPKGTAVKTSKIFLSLKPS